MAKKKKTEPAHFKLEVVYDDIVKSLLDVEGVPQRYHQIDEAHAEAALFEKLVGIECQAREDRAFRRRLLNEKALQQYRVKQYWETYGWTKLDRAFDATHQHWLKKHSCLGKSVIHKVIVQREWWQLIRPVHYCEACKKSCQPVRFEPSDDCDNHEYLGFANRRKWYEIWKPVYSCRQCKLAMVPSEYQLEIK